MKKALITIYKAFSRSHLDYGDVPYDQAFNNWLKNWNLFNITYAQPCRISKGYVKIKNRSRIGTGVPQRLTLVQKTFPFYKILESGSHNYLFSFISTRRSLYLTRNMHSNPFQTQNSFFENFLRRPLNGTTEMLILENLRAFRFLKALFLAYII